MSAGSLDARHQTNFTKEWPEYAVQMDYVLVAGGAGSELSRVESDASGRDCLAVLVAFRSMAGSSQRIPCPRKSPHAFVVKPMPQD